MVAAKRDMCKREEVEYIVNQANNQTREMLRNMQTLNETSMKAYRDELEEHKEAAEKRMSEVAITKVAEARDSFVKWIGFGGIVSVCMFVYFIGGLQNTVSNLEKEVADLNTQMKTDGKFTLEDGTKLKQYTDQQDQYIQKQVDSLTASVTSGFDEIKDLINAHASPK